MPRPPGIRPHCHLSWEAPHGSLVCGRQARGGGREEGSRGGQGRHHTFPQVSVSGGQRDRQSVLPGPVLPNPPATPGPVHPQASPTPPSAVLPSPILSQRPSAASVLHSPLNILSGGAQVPPPLHCIHPGPGTWQEPCLPGTRLLSTGVQKAGTHGGKSQPQGGTLHTLWDI